MTYPLHTVINGSVGLIILLLNWRLQTIRYMIQGREFFYLNDTFLKTVKFPHLHAFNLSMFIKSLISYLIFPHKVYFPLKYSSVYLIFQFKFQSNSKVNNVYL